MKYANVELLFTGRANKKNDMPLLESISKEHKNKADQ